MSNSQWPLTKEEEDRQRADLERLERQRRDPYRVQEARTAHARDIDYTRLQARNWGEPWAR